MHDFVLVRKARNLRLAVPSRRFLTTNVLRVTVVVDSMKRTLEVKGTNIVVESHRKVLVQSQRRPIFASEATKQNMRAIGILREIAQDDQDEAQWLDKLRPDKNLIHPSEAFAQGIKRLRPAISFNTYDPKKAKAQRRLRQAKAKEAYEKRRSQRVVPTVGLKNAMNPHKVPHEKAAAKKVLRKGNPKTKVRRSSVVDRVIGEDL